MSSLESASAILEVTSQPKKVTPSSVIIADGNCRHGNDNGALHSPSAESISTFQELEKAVDLVLEEGVDIVSRVDEPQKVVEPWGTYVTFRIRTKSTRWSPKETEYSVHRRYNDFKALRERLVDASWQVVPPLPSPHTLIGQLDRFSREFVLQRMVLLNIFIKRLVSHSILTHNNDLQKFLTASSSEFTHHFKSKVGYLTSISDSLYNLTSPNAVSTISSLSSRTKDPEFSSIADYMSNLHDKLSFLNSISYRVTKDRMDISTEMKNIKPILESWSQVERFNRETLKIQAQRNESIGEANDNFPLGNILKKMASPFGGISTEYHKLAKEYPFIIINPVKEYILYIEAVKDKLTKRDHLQASLEGAQDKLAKKRDKAVNGGPNSQPTSPQMPKLVQDIGESHDRLQCASEALRSDIHGWQRQKKTDIKMILIELAKRHIDFYEKSLSSWETVLCDKSVKDSVVSLNNLNLVCNNHHNIIKNDATDQLNDLQEPYTSKSTSEISDWENL